MKNLYDEKIEALISYALEDGVLSEKEKQVLFKKAQAAGIDLDEFEMVLDARLVELKKAEKSAPKSDKYGDVRKCPACGAMVPALAGICPECGYEFSGIESNLSSQKLAALIIENNSVEKRKDIIETFPIPNTKSDLFEFLTSMQPRIHDSKDPLVGSYFKKYEECINKAKVYFPDDSHLKSLIDSFEKEKTLFKKNNIMLNIKTTIFSLFSWAGEHKLLVGIIILILFLLPILKAIIEYIRWEIIF